MKRKKIKISIDFKSILNYILVILSTSVIFFSILVSLPLTEKYLQNTSYDLTTVDDSYWSKDYTLLLNSNDEKEAEQVRNILVRRLNNFGVEEVSTFKEYNEDKKRIKVVVETTKNRDIVDELIKNPFQVQIVTRKDDVDFEDEENPYAYMLSSNYNSTDWDIKDFRNVYLTELPTASGENGNFAIFKPWIHKSAAFQKFLSEYEGEYIGVNIDGFVTPYAVTTDVNKVFAISISTDEAEQVTAINLLYNSGDMPTQYTLESEKELTVDRSDFNYIHLIIGFTVALLITYAYLFFSKTLGKEIVVKTLVSTIFTLSIYIAVLKIFSLPIDLFILAIDVIFVAILNKILSENHSKTFYTQISILIIGLLLALLGIGYQRILGWEIIKLTVLTQLCLTVSDWYISKVKKILEK